MISPEDLRKRYQAASRHRDLFRDVFDDCYELALPRRMTMSDKTPGQRRDERIFDETAVTGVQEFASKLQSGTIPAFSQWVDLRAGQEVAEEMRDEANRQLAPVSRYMFELINQSNFTTQAHEAFLDLSIGTGCLLFEETMDSSKPFNFTAIGLPYYVLDANPSGEVGAVFRERRMRNRDVLTEYPQGTYTFSDPEMMVNIIDAVVTDPNAMTPTHYRMVMVKEDCRLVYVEKYKGEGSNPYIVFRWSKTPMERYGRGPLMDSLSSIKTLNLTIQMILENAQMAIAGMFNVEDDGVLNPDTIELVPGALIPHAPNSQGMRPVATGGRFDVAQLVLSDFRMNIRRSLFLDMLGDPDKTPASATEVAARQSELASRIGSAFTRLHTEFVNPVVQRAVHIMNKKGLIEAPQVDGKTVKAVAISPLAKRFQQEDVVNYTNYAQLLNDLYGPQIAMAILDQQQGAEFLADRFTVDPALNRSEEEKQAFLQMMSQQQQPAEQPPQQGGLRAVG